jgi:hypothetical protein
LCCIRKLWGEAEALVDDLVSKKVKADALERLTANRRPVVRLDFAIDRFIALLL